MQNIKNRKELEDIQKQISTLQRKISKEKRSRENIELSLHSLFNECKDNNLIDVELEDGSVIGGKDPMAPVSDEFYYIVSDKCTECMGFHEEPQCAAVCPVDCCVPDPDHEEDEETLLAKKAWLHNE
jgi:ferredoxin